LPVLNLIFCSVRFNNNCCCNVGRKRKAAEMGPEESSEDNIEPFEENQEDGTVQNQERMLEPVSSSLRDPELVAGLLDIVMVVWVKHAKELNEKAFAEKRSNFEETVQLSLDFVFREWKASKP